MLQDNAENVKHTSTPWDLGGDLNMAPYVVGALGTAGRDGMRVICDAPDSEAEDRANMALIVAAVNAHAALEARVAALETQVAKLADLLQSIESASDEMSITRFGDYYAEILSPIVRAELAEMSI